MFKKEKNELKYSLVTVLMYFTFFVFVIGILLNIEGVKILINAKKYRSGKLKVIEFSSGPSASGTESTIHAIGYIDKIKTGLLIGTTGHQYTDSIIRLPKEPPIYLPVWYKPDRKLTLDRYKDEKEFPLWRVSKNLLKYFVGFNCPFFVLLILRIQLRKKLNIG